MFNCIKRYFSCLSTSKDIRLGVFNIQNLSLKKISDNMIYDNLIKIINNYDLLFILELVDTDVLDKLNNKLNNKYKNIYSIKTGLTPQSSEHYGLFYNSKKIKINNQNIIECDKELFDRKPWYVDIDIINKMNIKCLLNHISPNNVNNELNNLNNIFNILYSTNPSNYILLGDYNADLPYLSKKDRLENNLYNNRKLMNITNDLITNVAKNEKKYDKIFITPNILNYLDKDNNSYVDEYYKTLKLDNNNIKKISDHLPIYINII